MELLHTTLSLIGSIIYAVPIDLVREAQLLSMKDFTEIWDQLAPKIALKINEELHLFLNTIRKIMKVGEMETILNRYVMDNIGEDTMRRGIRMFVNLAIWAKEHGTKEMADSALISFMEDKI